ncbi:MAG: type I-F CRISPR-associated endoribonuclease Cas6/Csy4 [Pseudomonas sp.]|nr:type I-F CRISPR-associated endoribonuclease Cas6/Csy4 [Pseudomonas sp.]
MRFYQEITLIKTPEISPYFIWGKLYMQLHLALVEQQNTDKKVSFGVSFPEYKYTEKESGMFCSLGKKLRVFANTEAELHQLNLAKWLERLTDYVHIKSIQPVPGNVNRYLLVKRYRADTNLERLTRRFMQRESKRMSKEISFKEARAMQNQRFANTNNLALQQAEQHYAQPTVKGLPFIKLKSFSTEEEYSLLIEQASVEHPCAGSFSTYGLSSKSTVPHW